MEGGPVRCSEEECDAAVSGGSDRHSAISAAGAAARIKALDRVTSSNLRKAQVINKVSDIVRELVENSLDAEATTVQVHMEKFGKDKIEVRDNGHGLLPSDVKHIFQGGFTSKLNDTSNLGRGKFLGFKGEALNAMCAAGNVTVVTKCPKEAAATKYKFDCEGRVISENKMAHGNGTMITVEKLFENIRVRRQRLDNAVTGASEMKEIEAFLKGVAIAHPKCHISFYHNSTLVWSKASVQTIEQALYAVLGHSIAKKLRKIGPIDVEVDTSYNKDENNVHRSVELYLPIKPVDMRTMSYTSNKMSLIFCNQKRVYMRDLEKLIHRYVTSNVERPQPSDQRRFPVSTVYIQVPPREADFNLDMDKTKVFLVHKDRIIDAIENALIEFYGVDLRNCAEESTVANPLDNSLPNENEQQNLAPHEIVQAPQIRATKGKKDTRIQSGVVETSNITAGQDFVTNRIHQASSSIPSDSIVNPILNTSSTSDSIRHSAINDFLRDIPSTSSAFVQSPVKPMNEEPVTMAFPKPKVDTQPVPIEISEQMSLFKKPGSSVVANFEISIASQESQNDVVATNQSKTGVDFSAIGPPSSSCMSAERSEQNRTEMADKYKRWLQGRLTDKYGDIMESVVPVNEPPPTNSQQEFRAALLAGSSKTPNLTGGARCGLQPSPVSQVNSMEPPSKRIRSDTPHNHPPFRSPVQCGTPRMPAPRQVTLESWRTPTSQTASETVVGVRIPRTPNHYSKVPNCQSTSRSSMTNANETSLPKSLTVWQQQERKNYKQQTLTVSQQNTTKDSSLITSSKTPMFSAKLTPKIHKEIQGGTCGQLYVAQTYDSIGVFSPLNMLQYFPNQSRESWSSTQSSSTPLDIDNQLISLDDVSKMFQQFVLREDINNTPVSDKIFHVLTQLPDLTKVNSRA